MRRPPWWPANEAWPPQDAEGWRELRRGFMRRAGCFIGFMLIVLLLLVGGLIWLIADVFGSGSTGLFGVIVVLLVFAFVLRGVFHAVRATAAPVGDLIEASGRVQSGELDVEVPERGMREVRALTRAFNAMSARLSATERERRRLLAEVSHELRTPLTIIQGNVEAMIDGLYPADREHLERVQAETRQMERLIDDLRTLSLAETGQLPLQREPTDVAALGREVVEAFGAEASGAGVDLTVEAAEELPEQEVDGRRLRQVISNLVANALRHTPRGGQVTVAVTAAGSGFQLTVKDNGSGMTADAVEHAFERFWREGESAGAGLGLAIVRDLVTAHGGTASITSQPGQGTTVICSFPG
ncbi:MAG: HAMP domain-containing sensor histidine kinase [Chloroflexota bacterium]